MWPMKGVERNGWPNLAKHGNRLGVLNNAFCKYLFPPVLLILFFIVIINVEVIIDDYDPKRLP